MSRAAIIPDIFLKRKPSLEEFEALQVLIVNNSDSFKVLVKYIEVMQSYHAEELLNTPIEESVVLLSRAKYEGSKELLEMIKQFREVVSKSQLD